MEKLPDEGVAIRNVQNEEAPMTVLTLKRLDERDIPDLLVLSASIGWDYTDVELRTVFASAHVYGHRSAEGILASSAAIFPYGGSLASIGMVMVNPNFRRLGLGKAVTQMCIDAVPRTTPIMLIATETGKLLYETIGFRTVETNYKFLCDRYQPKRTLTQDELCILAPLEETDLGEVLSLDAAARGANRDTFLKTRFAQSVDRVLVKQIDGTPVGYGFSIQGPEYRVIGPVVAPNHELAIAILHHLAKDHDGKLRVDVLEGEEQAHVHAFLLESGFENVTQPPVMLINAEELPPRNNTLFAIAQQAFG
jgi:predicted GNAT family N-acyltransferase